MFLSNYRSSTSHILAGVAQRDECILQNEGSQFDSWSGHMPGLQAGSPLESVQEAANQCLSCT